MPKTLIYFIFKVKYGWRDSHPSLFIFNNVLILLLAVLAVLPNQVQWHGLHTSVCWQSGGEGKEKLSSLKSCEHAWKQIDWNLSFQTTSRSYLLIHQLPFTFAYVITEWSEIISCSGSHCQRTYYMLLQFFVTLQFSPFTLHCPPSCLNVAMLLFLWHLLLAGKRLRPRETPAHPTHTCHKSSLYAVVWGHLPRQC